MPSSIRMGAFTVYDYTSYTTSVSFSHANDAADLLLRVVLHGNGVVLSNITATYNSVSMTSLGVSSDGTYNYVVFFYLRNAAIGTYNVAVSWTNSGAGSFMAQSLSGVAGYRTLATANGASSPVSVSPTSNPGDLVLDAGGFLNPPTAITVTPAAGQTSQKNSIFPIGIGYLNPIASYANAAASGGSTTMSWTQSASRAWVAAALALYGPEVGGVAVSPLYWI